MHVEPHVVALGQRSIARVNAHAHAHLGAGGKVGRRELALGGNGEPERVQWFTEDHEERVALGLDLRAVVGSDVAAQDGVVMRQDVRVLGAERRQQPSRALDVGEGEGDGPLRQARGGAHSGGEAGPSVS